MNLCNRRKWMKQAGAGALGVLGANLFGASRLAGAANMERQKLNFVFFLIDDMGWTDLACFGSKFYETPNVDRLAGQGMRFTNAYAACTVCSPTRASIMTGKYPGRLHITDWIEGHKRPYAKLRVPDWTMYLPHEEVTLAEALKPAGYVSASIGKWHLGKEEYWPDKQGFDVNIAGSHMGQPPSYFSPYKIATITDGPEGEYITDRLTTEAEKFIEANKDKPFFVYLPHFAVHTPLQAKKEVIARYEAKVKPEIAQKNATYAAMIEAVDESVGRIMKKLEERKIADRTVIVFMSDNGGLLNSTSNVPLRAGKGSPYEGGHRTPMIIKWPGVAKAGSVCEEPVISVDFYPTILEMADVRPAAGQILDGVSLTPLLRQTGGLAPRDLFWHYPHYHPGGATPYSAIRAGDMKLIEFFEDHRVEMYDLKSDLGETKDLAATMKDKAKALRERLDAWRKAVGAQLPTPNPDYDPVKNAAKPAPKKAAKEKKAKGKK